MTHVSQRPSVACHASRPALYVQLRGRRIRSRSRVPQNEQAHAMQMTRLAKARHPGRARAVVGGLATLGSERLTLIYKSRSLWVRMLRAKH